MDMKKTSGKLTMGCVLATVALVAAASTWSLTASLTAQDRAGPPSRRHADELSAAFRYAAKEALPSVVTIRTVAKRARPDDDRRQRRPRENPFDGTPFEDFFRDDPNLRRFFDDGRSTPQPSPTGMGTGVIIDSSGIVLTNNHVVEGDGEIIVRLTDGREFTATKKLTDPRTDVAVLWIENGGSLKAARLGDSDKMEIGDWVLAVGNPLGLYESVTAGIISAKGRGLGVALREDFLQTDAAINPGNSGGPLVNLDGEVIGINTAIASRTGGYQGYGFAIPINLVEWVASQLIEKGKVERAYLGTKIDEVTQEMATQFGVDVGSGALVGIVFADSPAEEAGLEPGDVIEQFGEEKVSGPRDLTRAVERSRIGSRQAVRILRDGRPMTLEVRVRAMPNDYGVTRGREVGRRRGPEQPAGELGIGVEPLTDEVARRLGMRNEEGVVITSIEPGSTAARADLSPGMVITHVNRRPVRSVEEYNTALKERSLDRESVMLIVRSKEGSRFVVISTDR